MSRMTARDEDYTYSVAWFDAVTKGKHLGRAVLTRGNKARLQDLSPKLRRDPLAFTAPSYGSIPEVFPNRMVNLATAKAFSAAWYRKAPKHRIGELQDITKFFHPLDIVAGWNRVYGPNGFLQYQFVVPFSEAETFRTCVQLIVGSGHLSCVNVLKRFGPDNPAPLSFPMPGWTLTVDLPIEEGLERLCNQLDEQVVAAGGRVYLAKDSRLGAATFRQMYPRLEDFLRVRRSVDPNHMFTSDLARRLRRLSSRSILMLDALGAPQSLLLLGGTSDIALAIARRYAADRPLRVVLAARPTTRRSSAAAGADRRRLHRRRRWISRPATPPPMRRRSRPPSPTETSTSPSSPSDCWVRPRRHGRIRLRCWS